MVSYRQLDQHGIKQVVLHERETSSSGRPKATSSQGEDEFFYYEYDSRGGLKQKIPKSPIEQYDYWFRHYVKFQTNPNRRITPLTEFEKQMGVRSNIPVMWYKGKKYNEKDWNIFLKQFAINRTGQAEIDYGELETHYILDVPKHLGQRNRNWGEYFRTKAEEQDLIVVNLGQLEFKKKHPYCIANNIHGSNCNTTSTPELPLPVVEKIPPPARPSPKEKSIASVKIEKPEPIEPIKEAVKYSPLMIAGVIAVVVILLLKRRRA